MTTLDIYVLGIAKTKGSWRGVNTARGIRLLPSANEKPWARAVAWMAKSKRPKLIAKPASVHVTLSFDVLAPKKASNTFPPGDVDKLARSCLDALTGICYADDSQVTKLTVEKQYALNCGARITVVAA